MSHLGISDQLLMSKVTKNTCFFNIGLFFKQFNQKRFLITTMNEKKILNMNCVNPFMKNIEYAVRGPIVDLATKLQDELNKVKKSLLYYFFYFVILNVGN